MSDGFNRDFALIKFSDYIPIPAHMISGKNSAYVYTEFFAGQNMPRDLSTPLKAGESARIAFDIAPGIEYANFTFDSPSAQGLAWSVFDKKVTLAEAAPHLKQTGIPSATLFNASKTALPTTVYLVLLQTMMNVTTGGYSPSHATINANFNDVVKYDAWLSNKSISGVPGQQKTGGAFAALIPWALIFSLFR